MSKLTGMQQVFVDEYLVDYNASQAAVRAGYADVKEGYKLMHKPHVQEAIEKAIDNRNKMMGIDKTFIIVELLDALAIAKATVKPKRNSKTGKPIVDEDGNPVYTRDTLAVLRILDQLAKHVDISAYNNKVDVTVHRDEELIEAIRRGKEQAGIDVEYTDT